MAEEWQQAITWLELGILGVFTAEYALRLWIAERPWKYALSLYGLVDLAAILPFYLAWGTETTALRAVRLLRLIRLWKQGGTPERGYGSRRRSEKVAKKAQSFLSQAD